MSALVEGKDARFDRTSCWWDPRNQLVEKSRKGSNEAANFFTRRAQPLRVARAPRHAYPTMGLQGKRWPKWKQRRDNSGQDITDENRKKKLHHGVKCIRKVG
jgi:hypothetical protein